MSDSDPYSVAAIFARVVEASGKLSPELCRHILSLQICEQDQRRVQVLLEKNREGLLSAVEREELDNLIHVANLLSLWHSRARRNLGG